MHCFDIDIKLLLLVSIHFSGSVITGNVLRLKLKLQMQVILKLAQLVFEELSSYSTKVLAVSFLLSCGAINISSELVGGLLACLATQAHTEHIVLDHMVMHNPVVAEPLFAILVHKGQWSFILIIEQVGIPLKPQWPVVNLEAVSANSNLNSKICFDFRLSCTSDWVSGQKIIQYKIPWVPFYGVQYGILCYIFNRYLQHEWVTASKHWLGLYIHDGSCRSFQGFRLYALGVYQGVSEHYKYIVAAQSFVWNRLAMGKVPGQYYCHYQIQINDICVGSNANGQPIVQWVQLWLILIGSSVLSIKWRGISWIYAYSVTVKYLQAFSPILWLSFIEWIPELVHSFATTVLDQRAMLQLAFLVQRQQFSDVPLTDFVVNQQIWDPGGDLYLFDGCQFRNGVSNWEEKQLVWFLIQRSNSGCDSVIKSAEVSEMPLLSILNSTYTVS
jgi:hypothetical protein